MNSLRYLVNYGNAAFLGRFVGDARRDRGDRVVLRTLRGLEIGSVLCEDSSTLPSDGDLVRHASSDEENQHSRNRDAAALALHQIDSADVLIVDLEYLLDDSPAFASVVADPSSDLNSLGDSLSRQLNRPVLIQNLGIAPAPAPAASGCGKPGCGSTPGGGCGDCGTGGGCSTGSCSKGSVKNAGELTDYFAGLRKQMEATTARIPL